MTKEAMKEMIADIINNDAWYEVKKCNRECNVTDGLYCDCDHKKWVLYELGDEIHLDWEYRKIVKWCVTTQMACFELEYLKSTETAIFIGREEDCKKYVKEHKTWLEENYPVRNSPYDAFNKTNIESKIAIKKVCEKILEELKNEKYLPTYEGVFNLIKDLGVAIQ